LTKQQNTITKIVTKASNNRKLYVFLFCLFLATFFWLLNSLGNHYTTDIEVQIVYINSPKDKVILNDQPKNFKIRVKGLGFDLMAYKIRPTEPLVTLDLSQLNRIPYNNKVETYSISTYTYSNYIANQLGDEIEIKSIFPDSIQFVMDKAIQKQVKIIPSSELSFKKQFQLYGEILAKPAVTTIIGASSIIDTIDQVYTERLEYNELSETVTETVGFDKSYAQKKIKFSPNKVLVHIPVEKFTESSKMVAITTVNVPDSIELKTIPKEVEIKFTLPLSKMANLESATFKTEVDYQQISNSFNHKLKVDIVEVPDYISISKINPTKVEYILKRK
jgi:hypothetical protein